MKLVLKVALVTALWAAPLTIIGLVLCVTVVGIPLGMALMVIGCKPVADLVHKRSMIEYAEERDLFLNGDNTALDEGIGHPWLD